MLVCRKICVSVFNSKLSYSNTGGIFCCAVQMTQLSDLMFGTCLVASIARSDLSSVLRSDTSYLAHLLINNKWLFTGVKLFIVQLFL